MRRGRAGRRGCRPDRELVAQLLVHAVHVPDLARADADVACGDVGLCADVPEELRHERLREERRTSGFTDMQQRGRKGGLCAMATATETARLRLQPRGQGGGAERRNHTWQKRMISPSDLPLGSKSEPPFPPPSGRPVSEFLKT